MYEGRSCIFGTGGWNFYPRHRVSNDCDPSHRFREEYQTCTNFVALISRLELAVGVCVRYVSFINALFPWSSFHTCRKEMVTKNVFKDPFRLYSLCCKPLAKSWTTVSIFTPQNADFLIVLIFCCIGHVDVDMVGKKGIQMGHRDYWEGRGGVSERWQGWGNRSNRLREHSGATKSAESAGKLCEGKETCTVRAELRRRWGNQVAVLERSGVEHCGIVQVLTVFRENVQEVQAYRALKLTHDNS